MSVPIPKIMNIESFSTSEILDLFNKCRNLKAKFLSGESIELKLKRKPAVLSLFFESSTRTKVSFEIASRRLGFDFVDFSVKNSSIDKGESLKETVNNLMNFHFDIIVTRFKEPELYSLFNSLPVPVICAGYGTESHPTQALLDAFTLLERFSKLQGLKILFVGDIRHSRVFSSHCQLAKMLGYEIGICAPKEFLPTNLAAEIKVWETLKKGITWCDACEVLRVQFERHTEAKMTSDSYYQDYGLNEHSMHWLNENQVILHPGPFNDGVDFSSAILSDNRVLVYKQVENGMFVRSSLMKQIILKNEKLRGCNDKT
jgi:aspartate carbamoyltransferase catalytic subunit